MIICASLASFLGTAGASRPDAARAAIVAQSQALMVAIETGDAAAIADLFSSEAKISVSMSGGVVSGRESIKSFWQAALGGGLKSLVLAPVDLVGDGGLRVETGTYQAFGVDHRELGHGQYLLAWVKEAGVWKISRDFAHGDSASSPTPGGTTGAVRVPDRVGLPAGYATQFRVLGGTVHDELHGLTTVYANDVASAVANTEAANYPNGSVILMEFADPQRDGEAQLLRDARGQPLKGPVTHIDVMRRGGGFGEVYGASRAGEWEFASYRADGTTLIAPANAEQCAACHLKAGAEKDFVFRLRAWE
jgi:ketosteroid isomerase-like protein